MNQNQQANEPNREEDGFTGTGQDEASVDAANDLPVDDERVLSPEGLPAPPAFMPSPAQPAQVPPSPTWPQASTPAQQAPSQPYQAGGQPQAMPFQPAPSQVGAPQQAPLQQAPPQAVPPPAGGLPQAPAGPVANYQAAPGPNPGPSQQYPNQAWSPPPPPVYTAPMQAPRPSRQSNAAVLVSALLIVVALVVGFASGNWFGARSANTSSDGVYRSSLSEISLRIEEVYTILDHDALHVYTDDELDEATRIAIEGLLEAGGDNRSQYMNQEEFEQYIADSSGEYVGIGITLAAGRDKRPTVTRVFADSPASEAGIEPGDVVLAIDGEYKDWTVDEVVSSIRREAGTEVSVVWDRNGTSRSTTMQVRTVYRQIVTYAVIETGGKRIGYILLEQFTTNSPTEVRNAIRELESQGVDCYILDLRDNPGGYLEAAIEIASMFLKSGVIVRIEERNSSSEKSVLGRFETDKPLAVLINGASASASELVSAAFQDHGRAIVVGEQSYGKGTVQDMRLLSFGGAIKFTIANYLTPNGHVVEGVGVTPDIVVDDGLRINDADLIHRLEAGEDIDFDAEGIDMDAYYSALSDPRPGDPRYVYRAGDDVQLDAAIQALLEQ